MKNIHEARSVLRPPFIFGGSEQIAAADFVALFETAIECLEIAGYSRECDACGGDGRLECSCDCGRQSHWRECETCEGTGAVLMTLEYIEGLDEESLNAIIAELHELRDEELAGVTS